MERKNRYGIWNDSRMEWNGKFGVWNGTNLPYKFHPCIF